MTERGKGFELCSLKDIDFIRTFFVFLIYNV